jgi:hypothetical protein
MTAWVFPVQPIRSSLAEIKLESSWIATKAPELADLVSVRDHAGALAPDRVLVVGDRGTGKSYWSAALFNEPSRLHITRRYPRLGLEKTHVSLGFSDAPMGQNHPSAKVLKSLSSNFDADDIWRSVVLDLAPFRPESMPSTTWMDKVKWVAEDEDGRSAAFVTLDQRLAEKGETYLVVFDALDRLATSWTEIRALTAGLLRLALDLRSLKRIKIKIFIRPDMADDAKLWAVGDASKLRHNEVKLQWKRRDLYGLLWMRLANDADSGSIFRAEIDRELRLSFGEEGGVWTPPAELLEDEEVQRAVFYAMAGQYMGKTHKQGRTYDWAPNHLANASGHATPRSFLIAMKEAASSAKSSATVFDIGGLQEAVRKASDIRVGELLEDYAWINTVFLPLRGMLVPAAASDFYGRWVESGALGAIQRAAAADQTGRYLPPVELNDGANEQEGLKGLIQSLLHLKVIDAMEDGRLNMPDLFRLAAKVKRRGGVKLRP